MKLVSQFIKEGLGDKPLYQAWEEENGLVVVVRPSSYTMSSGSNPKVVRDLPEQKIVFTEERKPRYELVSKTEPCVLGYCRNVPAIESPDMLLFDRLVGKFVEWPQQPILGNEGEYECPDCQGLGAAYGCHGCGRDNGRGE